MSGWEESEELDEFLNEEREVFTEPTAWMRQTDKVIDAYKNEVDLLRAKQKDVMRRMAGLVTRMQNLEKAMEPLKRAMQESKEP